MTEIVAITIGDINGIGIQILIDSWKKNKINNFILFCDYKYINTFLEKKNIYNEINIINFKVNNKIKIDRKRINIFTYKSKSLEDNTYKSLKYAYMFCKKNICIGILTLPLRKDLIKEKINSRFIGQTEYFQNLDKKKSSNMILYHEKIIISPITTHIEVKNISKVISNKSFIYNQIFSLWHSLKNDFNIKNPRLILSGLNPHAGENGKIGKEEIDTIIPIVKQLNKKGIFIKGPFSADSILIKNNLKKYDCFIFIYHDQALIPFKFISQFTGVNFTGNLSIIRTSPDHGTAYNLVGSKEISDASFINSYKLIKKIYKNRNKNAQS